MEASPRLRRAKSVKRALSARARRDSVMEEEDSLPSPRDIKPTLVQLHVTADDIALRPTAARPSSSSLRVPSARNTWPQGLRERRPGTYAFDQIPTLTRTPWEQNRALRSAPRRSRSTTRSSISSQTFARLPREILHCVLGHLRESRITGPHLNVTSHRNDLRKLCVANKQWHRVAREHLYREIWLPGEPPLRSSGHQLASILSKSCLRLRLLSRTLEEAPGLAHLVRRLCIPASIASAFDCEVYLESRRDKTGFLDPVLPLICQIVRQCPNLQALSGHHALACDRTTELIDTLASRPKIKEHVWNLPRCSADWQTLLQPGAFVDYHSGWRELESLVIAGDRLHSDRLGPGTVTAMLQRLPSLRHLMLKGLSRTEFHNGTLLMLPALRSLRLEDVSGVTDHGLQQLVHSRLAMSLERLSIVHLEITSLRTVQALWDNLPRLTRFCLIQEVSPELQEVFSFNGTTFSLRSPTLEYLHWNALLPGNATAILANSIAAGKFPKLGRVKVPCDYDGAIQKLCRPIEQRPLTGRELAEHSDDARTSGLEYRKTTQFLEMEAELRAKRARKDSVFSVTVEDEDGVEQFQWAGSYLGSISSNIWYDLEPDIEGQQWSHARIEDLSRPARCEGGCERLVGLEVLF